MEGRRDMGGGEEKLRREKEGVIVRMLQLI
jgi:hypothetical protein